MCDICKDLESVTVPANETRRVVVADSTMHRIWGEVHQASTEHFDIDSIVGGTCLLYTSPSPRDLSTSRMPSSA